MMKKALCDAVLAALRDELPIHVLRGLDERASMTSDVDLITPPGRAHTACVLAAREAVLHGWYLVGFRSLGYVASATFVKPSSEGDQVTKLDFIDGLAWRGIALDDHRANPFSDTWENLHNGWRDQRVLGALTFLQKIMAAGSLTAKEWSRVANCGTTPEYLAKLTAAVKLPITREEIEVLRISTHRKWRLRAASCGVRGPLTFVRWVWRVAAATLRQKLGFQSGSGLVLGISGPDGCGKSTLVDRFVAACAKSGGSPQIIHLLPNWIPMPHQVLNRKQTRRNYTRPYAEPPVTSHVNGLLRLAYYICAFAMTRAWLAVSAKRGKLIVLDRSVVDFASDLTRARIPAGLLPRRVLTLITPNGQLFYLNVSPATAVARKGELTLDRATSLQASYLAISRALRIRVLDADARAETVFRDFLGALSQEYMRRISPYGGVRAR